MFKTKEELTIKTIDDQYIAGIEDAFKSFAERVEFYKRYVYNESSLEDEEKYIADKWFDYVKEQERKKIWIEINREVEYNDWLFNYCFGDVVE